MTDLELTPIFDNTGLLIGLRVGTTTYSPEALIGAAQRVRELEAQVEQQRRAMADAVRMKSIRAARIVLAPYITE